MAAKNSLAGELRQLCAGDAVSCPDIHCRCAHGEIEINARLVPVQAPPFQSSAAACNGDFGKLREQTFSVAFAAVVGKDEEVFEVDARAAEKR